MVESDILKYKLFHSVRDGYVHVTSKNNFLKIIESKHIINNKNENFTYPQSENSLCYLLGGVSLFDFEIPDEYLFRNVIVDHFSEFFTVHEPITIVIKLLKDDLVRKILFAEELKAKNEKLYKILIPNVEVCYLGNIHINNIEEAFMICAYDRDIYVKITRKQFTCIDIQKFEQKIKNRYEKTHGEFLKKKLSQENRSFADMMYLERYQEIYNWLAVEI